MFSPSLVVDFSGRKSTILFIMNKYKRNTKQKYNRNEERYLLSVISMSSAPMIQIKRKVASGDTCVSVEWDEHEERGEETKRREERQRGKRKDERTEQERRGKE